MIQDVAVDAHVAHELGHVGTLPGEHNFSGGVVNAERISSQARTDSQARALICSREPKAHPSAVVPRVRAEDGDGVTRFEIRNTVFAPVRNSSTKLLSTPSMISKHESMTGSTLVVHAHEWSLGIENTTCDDAQLAVENQEQSTCTFISNSNTIGCVTGGSVEMI